MIRRLYSFPIVLSTQMTINIYILANQLAERQSCYLLLIFTPPEGNINADSNQIQTLFFFKLEIWVIHEDYVYDISTRIIYGISKYQIKNNRTFGEYCMRMANIINSTCVRDIFSSISYVYNSTLP